MNYKKILFWASILLFSVNVNAALIQIDFEGRISSAGSFEDPTGLFTKGDSINGFWQFESTTPDSDPDLDRGFYNQTGLPSFEINIGSYFFQANTYGLQILDNRALGIGVIDAYDVLGLSSTTSSNISGFSTLRTQLTFRDTQVPLDAILSDALFETAPNLAAFDQVGQVQGQITGTYNGSQFFMNLEIDSVTSSASVPEPTVIALLSAGLVGLGFARRRAKKLPN